MNIEEGKHYVTRDGRIVGPIKLNPHVYSSQTYPYRAVGPGEGDGMLLWREDGFCCEDRLHDNDLVSEWVDPVCITTADRLIGRLHQVTAFLSDGDELEIRAEIAIVDYLYDKVDARISALEAQS